MQKSLLRKNARIGGRRYNQGNPHNVSSKRGYGLDIEYLREFVELANDASFTRTANRFGMSQPTLSKHIAALEKEFGIRVFERSNLRTVLTPAGKLLLDDAQAVLSSYDAARDHMDSYRKSRPYKLKLELFKGYKPTDDLLATAEEEFRRNGITIEIEAVDIIKPPLEEIRQGNVDVGLLVHPNAADLTGLESVPVVIEPLVAVVSRDHPLAEKDIIEATDLSGNVVWTIEQEGSVQFARRYEEILLAHGAQPRFMPTPWQNGQSSYTRIAFVDSGVFVTFASVAKYSMPVTATRHKVLRFSQDDMNIAVSAVWRKDDTNPAPEMFVNMLLHIVNSVDMSAYWK